MASLLLLSLAVLAPLVARRLCGDFVHPAGLVLVAWCGTLGLFCLRLVPYPPLRGGTIALLAGAVAALVCGTLAGAAWARDHGARKTPAAAQPSEWWLVVYALAGLAGTAWYIAAARAALGPDAFSRPEQLRGALTTLKISSTFLFLQFFCVAAPIVLTAMVATGRRVSALAWVLVVAAVVSTWITTDRTQFFLVVLTCAFVLTSVHGERMTLGRLAVVGLVAGTLLAANFTLVGLWLGKTADSLGIELDVHRLGPVSAPIAGATPVLTFASLRNRTAGQPLQDEARPATTAAMQVAPTRDPVDRFIDTVHRHLRRSSQVYVYATGSYIALDALLQIDRPLTRGAHIFYPIARLLERAGLVDGGLPPAIPPFLPVLPRRGADPIPFNGYTFLFYPIEDFGVFGGLVYALVVGFGCGVAYGYVREHRRSPIRAIVLGHCLTALLLTVFVNKFNNTAWWYILLATLAPFAVQRLAALRPAWIAAAPTAPR